jgi:hypothetical protein
VKTVQESRTALLRFLAKGVIQFAQTIEVSITLIVFAVISIGLGAPTPPPFDDEFARLRNWNKDVTPSDWLATSILQLS